MAAFSRLVRFLAKDGRTYYGDAILPQGVSDLAKTKQARVIKGDIFGKHNVTEQIVVSLPHTVWRNYTEEQRTFGSSSPH
ncbi:hypothetical protein ABVK25_005384 [Lepraria finkii]|uniref:Uncharacterized protein n=1 Tax=Lepraria finkii TaxID=1340010 RepID=A0ABR4B9Z4_9LECA